MFSRRRSTCRNVVRGVKYKIDAWATSHSFFEGVFGVLSLAPGAVQQYVLQKKRVTHSSRRTECIYIRHCTSSRRCPPTRGDRSEREKCFRDMSDAVTKFIDAILGQNLFGDLDTSRFRPERSLSPCQDCGYRGLGYSLIMRFNLGVSSKGSTYKKVRIFMGYPC